MRKALCSQAATSTQLQPTPGPGPLNPESRISNAQLNFTLAVGQMPRLSPTFVITVTKKSKQSHFEILLKALRCMCYTQKRIPLCYTNWASLVAQTVKRLPAVQETWAQPLGWEDPLEEGMATHSSILAWEIPRTEKPGRLRSMGLQRVGHD